MKILARFPAALAVSAALLTVLGACGTARRIENPQIGQGLAITLEGATVDAERRVEVTYRVADRAGRARSMAGVENRWTLAQLGTDPEGVPAYVALVRTGADVTVNGVTEKQPGFETSGAVTDLGNGRYRYTYATPLPEGYSTGATYRVGLFSRLNLAPAGGTPVYDADAPNAVLDFAPAVGAPVQTRQLVTDAACGACHVEVRAHGGFRRGVQICTTCHTYQLYDPDTVDPVRPVPAGGAPAQPNELDFGRLVHRIHRGADLQSIQKVASLAATASGTTSPTRAGLLSSPLAKYHVVGFGGSDAVFAQVRDRTERSVTTLVTEGVRFPRDIRDCDACHASDAKDAGQHLTAASQRTCRSCHDLVYYPDEAQPTALHFPHPAVPGLVSSNAGACQGCHGGTGNAEYEGVRVGSVHVDPLRSAAYQPIELSFASIDGAVAGQNPTITFDVKNQKDGSPVTDLATLTTLNVVLTGATPDFSYTTSFLSQSAKAAAPVAGTPGRFRYTFQPRAPDVAAIPAGATGTWAFGMEARRTNAAGAAASAGDPGHPLAGLVDRANNPVEYRDVAGGQPQPRRISVTTQRCDACHGQLSAHGGQRNDTQYCVFCHTYDATDWGRRRRIENGSNAAQVPLALTPDDVEERSIDFKRMIHRIHTGERLVLTRPFAIYGFGPPPANQSLNYFDDVRVPQAAVMRCTSCHEEDRYLPEAIPAGARPTVANETGTLRHQGSPVHAADEPATPPMQDACLACHDYDQPPTKPPGSFSLLTHVRQFTRADGSERCAECHGATGVAGVKPAHGLEVR